MRKKTWLWLGLVLLALIPLAAQQVNLLQPKASPAVHDSKGKPLGTIIGTDPYPLVLFRSGREFVALGVRGDRLRGESGIMLFTTTDCSGTPSLQFAGPPLIASSFVKNDGTLFVSHLDAPVKTVAILSYIASEENFPNAHICNQTGMAWSMQVTEAQAAGNVYEIFQPPFSLH